MKDLHSKSQKLMTDIDKMADSYMSNIKKNSVDKNKKTMAIIESKFEAAKELSDDTVQVSIQNYSLVCRYCFVKVPNPIIVLFHCISVSGRCSNSEIRPRYIAVRRTNEIKGCRT